jgi:hypothetical protein
MRSVEIGRPPRGAGGGVGRYVGPGRQWDHHVVWRGDVDSLGGDRFDCLGQLVGMLKIDREEAVVSARSAKSGESTDWILTPRPVQHRWKRCIPGGRFGLVTESWPTKTHRPPHPRAIGSR